MGTCNVESDGVTTPHGSEQSILVTRRIDQVTSRQSGQVSGAVEVAIAADAATGKI